METTRFKLALTNGQGLGRAIFFTGLDKPMVIAPALEDEPMLTVQLFYFLGRQHSVAWVEFPRSEVEEMDGAGSTERVLEGLLDNYLFALSRHHPEFKLTSKVHQYPFRHDMSDDLHFGFDYHATECLAIDTLNDDSVKNVEVLTDDGFARSGFDDFLAFREIIEPIRASYEATIRAALKTVVRVTTVDHDVLGSGSHILPIVKLNERPLTFEEMDSFRSINPSNPGPDSQRYFVSTGSGSGIWIPKLTVHHTTMYDGQLLAYYFSGLRDPSPIVQFKNYYNVLEFFFESDEVQAVVGRTEKEQLSAVIDAFVTHAQARELISEQSPEWRRWVSADVETASGVFIGALDLTASHLPQALSERIYSIRNACVHSKSKRKGKVTARFVPSLVEETRLELEIPIIRELAARCIERFGRTNGLRIGSATASTMALGRYDWG